jgi:hypothetical protein
MERTRTACLALALVIRPHDARWHVVPAPQVPCCGYARTSTPPAPLLLAHQTVWTARVSSVSNTTGRSAPAHRSGARPRACDIISTLPPSPPCWPVCRHWQPWEPSVLGLTSRSLPCVPSVHQACLPVPIWPSRSKRRKIYGKPSERQPTAVTRRRVACQTGPAGLRVGCPALGAQSTCHWESHAQRPRARPARGLRR